MTTDRELDLVVFGTTGFVGKLTADYLARTAPADLRIGLAGRSADKLATVRSELPPAAADWPLVQADSSDPATLQAMAERARVVVTTVGPYASYGLPLVEACAGAGTDYCDLTGEVLFVREAIERYDRVAKDSGARIVNSCGFDSIPSDLGVLLLHEAARADDAGDLGKTTLMVTAVKGGFSGGTIASLTQQFEALGRDPSLGRVVADPYALSPDRSAEPSDDPDFTGVDRDSDTGRWLGPFVMAVYNTRVVRRSNALTGWSYGRDFRYREAVSFGDKPLGLAGAIGMSGALRAVYGAMSVGAIRSGLGHLLPSPGQGPSESTRRRGLFRIEVHTRTSGGRRYVADVQAQGDPGYAATAVMLGESALCLALDRDRTPKVAGLLTPATALGLPLVDRLRAAGQTWAAHPFG